MEAGSNEYYRQVMPLRNVSEREKQWQQERHCYSDDELQGQTHFYVVGKRVFAGVHHECVRRCRER